MFLSSLEFAPSPTPGVPQVARTVVWEDRKYGQLALPAGYLVKTPPSIPMASYLVAMLPPDAANAVNEAITFHHFAYRGGFGWTKDMADSFLADALASSGLSDTQVKGFYVAAHEFGHDLFNTAPLISGSLFASPEQYEDYQATRLRVTPVKPADDAVAESTDNSDQPDTPAASPAQ